MTSGPRHIALFIDGTDNDALGTSSAAPSNVFALERRLAAVTPKAFDTVAHYIPGVGLTRREHEPPDWWHEAGLGTSCPSPWTHTPAGQAVGRGIECLVQEAYAFLVLHYKRARGDRIYLFGFSRGAFAARSLAAFIDRVGILYHDRLDEVPLAYRAYIEGRELGHSDVHKLPETQPGSEGPSAITIHMLGVWDTVARINDLIADQTRPAIIHGHDLTRLPPCITNARHALALHEVRPLFEPLLFEDRPRHPHTLQQVWFAGAHADVGGGYADAQLSNVALEWMACEAQTLKLDVDARPAPTLPASQLGPIHHESRGLFGIERWVLRLVPKAVRHALTPAPRRVLSLLAAGDAIDRACGHRLHGSALSRLLALDDTAYACERGATGHRGRLPRDVSAAATTVDALTVRWALRAAVVDASLAVPEAHCEASSPSLPSSAGSVSP